MSYFFLFLLGLCVGSFINCLVYRLNSFTSDGVPKGLLRGVIFGWSICPKCKHRLAWKDNIPLLSFALLKGKCRYCHSPISWQYPIVELITGILTLITFYLSVRQIFNFEFLIFNLLITYSLIAIFVSDLVYQIIPDQIVYPAIGVNLIYNFLSYFPFTSEESWLPLRSSLPPSEVFWGYLLAGLSATGFFFLLFLFTKSKGMGLGDVKLAGLMGLILGWPKVAVALFLAFLTGAFIGVILVIMGKKRLNSHIPFGPFLTAATFISLFWGGLIWQWWIEKIMG